MKEVVLSFLDALNREDFSSARDLLHDDMQFIGVMGTRDGADVYIADMQKMKFKYKVLQAFEVGDEVAVFYDIDMGKATVFAAGWYSLLHGKIKQFKVLFDPRGL